MAPIPWDPRLETGDSIIDRQHRAVHELFNELESADDDPAAVLRALDFLTEHVLVHFATEEDLMARAGYPAALAEVHKAQHRQLTDKVRAHVLAFREGQLSSRQSVADALREWLTTHVGESDLHLVEYVRDEGASAEISPAWLDAERRASA
jgi:hemerythrin-like metal-binding protein